MNLFLPKTFKPARWKRTNPPTDYSYAIGCDIHHFDPTLPAIGTRQWWIDVANSVYPARVAGPEPAPYPPCQHPGCHKTAVYGPSSGPTLCPDHMPNPAL